MKFSFQLQNERRLYGCLCDQTLKAGSHNPTGSGRKNYPNPFNPTKTVQYTLQKPQRVSLIVTDLYGREVERPLDSKFKEAGSHQMQFDAAGLPSGVYFYSLIAGGQRQTRKMVVLR